MVLSLFFHSFLELRTADHCISPNCRSSYKQPLCGSIKLWEDRGRVKPENSAFHSMVFFVYHLSYGSVLFSLYS
ncbi:hypothetical protein CDL12_17718 [Handroanthus impetiginosus]|uniref:Uncharacterized protein n=1 Tax=Handroanthus impetiginosus TaxID=429701 RepID=A0A2G9GWW2_9LAMI|nr:hypothetical protein CDL12_17718 [Handroanthus impetiginosus]